MDKGIEHVLNVIDSALALAGFKIMDGDHESIIIRDCENDIDYEIKIEEII